MRRLAKLMAWSLLCFGLFVWSLRLETLPAKAESPPGSATSFRNKGAGKRSPQNSERQALMAEGRAAQLIADYPKALAEYQEGLQLAQASGNKKATAKFLSNIGTVHRDLGDYERALEYLERALATRRELGDRRGEGMDLTRLSSVYEHLGDYTEAFQSCEQALAIAKETGEPMIQANALAGMGSLYRQTGQLQKALEAYSQALALDRESQRPLAEASALASMGELYCLMGQYEKSLQLVEQSLAIRKGLNHRRGISRCLNVKGTVCRRLGQGKRALQYYEESLAINREIKDRRGEAGSLNMIGNLYANNLRQNDKALQFHEPALSIAREIKDRRAEGTALNSIGVDYYGLRQYEQALQFLQQGLAIHREIKDRLGEGVALYMMGYCYRDSGRQEQARQAFSSAIGILAEVVAPEQSWRALRGLGSVEARLGRNDEAVVHYGQALDVIESLRSELGEEKTKTTFMQSKLQIYDEFIILLQTLHGKYPNKGYDRKSLEVFERKQGRVFLEEVGQSGARSFAGLPESVRARESDLDDRVALLQSTLAEERSKAGKGQRAAEIRSMQQQLTQATAAQASLQKEIRANHPDYYALKYPQPATLSDLQERVLKPGEVILVYGVLDNGTCLWVIAKDHFRLFSIGAGLKEIESKVHNFRKGLETVLEAIRRKEAADGFTRILRSSLKDLEQNGRELYGLLIPEGAQKIIAQAGTIYVVPTGHLYSLPFEALVSPGKAGAKEPAYLLEGHSVAYLPSASLLKVLREARARKRGEAPYPLLAFANPVYPGMKSSLPKGIPLRSAAPDAAGASVAGAEILDLRAGTYLQLMGGSFPGLPDTEDEAREIKSILGAPDASQPLQLKEAASRSNVFRFNRENKLNQYRYLVFACHGILPGEVDFVTQPALVLSHPDPSTQQGGFLTMADVLGLQLNADLVTLSACNTGRGKLQRGEGVIGLTRAFMFAGTRAITVTLWSVESKSAKTLTTGLYHNLKSGKNLAESLRAAKLRMIHREAGEYYDHPFFWAPLVMMGDVS